MAKAGGTSPVSRVTLTFDDAAAASLPPADRLVLRHQQAHGLRLRSSALPLAGSLARPVPALHYKTNFSTFNGYSPMGPWSLYVIDDTSLYSGAISNGWSLRLTTANYVPAAADLAIAITGAPNPVTVTSNITYSISVTNFGPSTAANVVVTNSLPAGTAFLPAASSPGADASVPGLLIYQSRRPA